MMILFLLFTLLAIAVHEEQITAIATGTGFGSCIGYIQLWKAVYSPIGCPDCNHRGLEWIDVYTDEQSKRPGQKSSIFSDFGNTIKWKYSMSI